MICAVAAVNDTVENVWDRAGTISCSGMSLMIVVAAHTFSTNMAIVDEAMGGGHTTHS